MKPAFSVMDRKIGPRTDGGSQARISFQQIA
jgi:hypothetical protein